MTRELKRWERWTYGAVAGLVAAAAGLAVAGQMAGELTTVEGDALTFGSDGTTVNGANVVCADVTTANATVHIIDSVLTPPAAEMSGEMSESMTA
ncbi:MAG TPA: fasciclin domain-containing protein [Ilumatobacter sp.]